MDIKNKEELTQEELASLINTLDSFNTTAFSDGILKDISIEKLQKWMCNPSTYKDELQNYAMYQYISDGDIFALFDLIRVLPNLNCQVDTFSPSKNNISKIEMCKRYLNELNHKELTRDILSQLITTGTLVGVWCNTENKKECPYLMIFDDLDYFFPGRRVKGKWSVWCDLSYFATQSQNYNYKMEVLDNLYPYITIDMVNQYLEKGNDYRYVEFPIERSVCLRTHTLKREQRFGIPWNTSAIFDLKHKQKLRNLEKSASNKVMNAVAVLTMGIDGGESTWKKLGKKLTKATFESVKKGLTENEEGTSTVVGLPEWGKLDYPDTHVDDILDPDKITSINDDISNDTGIARGLVTGKDTTYAVAKLNLDIIFSRIKELLENIEVEVYNKFLKLILPKTMGSNFFFTYEKNFPLSVSERITFLQSLVNMGYSVKYLTDALGIDFNEFIAQSKYEIEELKLREIIKPPLTSYTATGDDLNKEKDGDDGNSSTQSSRENDESKTPKPSDKKRINKKR